MSFEGSFFAGEGGGASKASACVRRGAAIAASTRLSRRGQGTALNEITTVQTPKI